MTSSGAPLTIEDGTAAWPLLGLGRRAVNSDPLAARVPAGSCAATSTLSIDVTSTEGAVVASRAVDPRPGTSTVVPLADATTLPTPGSIDATFTVPSGGAITDVDLRIDELRHTFLGDLRIELLHEGVTVVIADQFGDPAFGGDDIVDAIFDDAALALPPNTGAGPVTGRVKPSGLLADLNGRPAAGVWTLRVTDTFPADSGELRRWGLDSPQVGCGRVEIPDATTGSASGVGPAAATLAGSVTPNGRATGLRFSYGSTAAYGTSTAVQDVGAGDAAVAGTAALTGLAPNTTYHFRAEAIRESGVVAVTGADATFTTAGDVTPPPPPPPPPPRPPVDRIPPVFTGRVAVKLTKGTIRGRKRATFSFTLSEAASVKVVLRRYAKGVRRGKTCVAPPRKGRRCTRLVPAGTTTRVLTKPGAGVLALSSAGLRRGTYTATLVATDAAGNRSAPRRVRFTVR
jgi:subtilisin-like proprotein convertase family protein